jgi:hypothetical protein
MIRYPRLLNPGTANEIIARDIVAWIHAYGDLQPFYRRGQTFIEKGTYDRDKATRLFFNLVNSYYKEYARDQHIGLYELNVATRKLAATKLRDQFEHEIGYSFPKGNRGRRKRNCGPDGIERDKWIPAHAVRFNKDGSVSMLR